MKKIINIINLDCPNCAKELEEEILKVEGVTVYDKKKKKNIVSDVTFNVRAGEIVCLAGIEGNGQTQFVSALTGLNKM